MSGGKEKKATNRMIGEQYQQEKAAYGKAAGRAETDLTKYGGRGDVGFQDLERRYQSLADTSTPTPSSRGGAGGGGGGFAGTPSSYEAFQKGLTAPGGGWDPGRLASIQGDIRDVRSMSSDPEIARRMRGAGVFDEFAQTGGYSEADKSNIRARGTSGVSAMFGRMKDEANRIASIQGGYGPGSSALMSRFGREQAGAASDAALNAELGISEGVRTGRMGAAQALSGAEEAYQGGRLQSLQGASGMESGLESDIYGRNVAGQNALEEARRRRSAQASARSAQAQAANRWERQFARQGQMAGLEGLSSLYGASESGYGRGLDYEGRNRGIGAGVQQGNLGLRIENNPQRSWIDVLGAAGGVAGAFRPSSGR